MSEVYVYMRVMPTDASVNADLLLLLLLALHAVKSSLSIVLRSSARNSARQPAVRISRNPAAVGSVADL
jgi:hypothetical protein